MPNTNAEWAILGGLRFALATIVIGAHLTWFDPQSPLTALADLSALAAVIGFLMVSGYSIAHSLQQSANGFYRRRVRRIMPLYIVALCFSFAIGRLPGFEHWPHGAQFGTPPLGEFITNWFFLQVFTGKPIRTDVVLWTLAVEVFFYVIAPWIRKASDHSLLVGIFVSAIAYILYSRFMTWSFFKVAYGGNLAIFAWPWLLGFYMYLNKSRSLTPFLAFAIPILTCALGGSRFVQAGWWLPMLASAACIAYGSRVSVAKGPATLLSALGDISYPLYLIHLPSLILLYDVFGLRSGFLMYLACLATAWLLNAVVTGKALPKAVPNIATLAIPPVAEVPRTVAPPEGFAGKLFRTRN
jgi:peptidoglycan/LPS O-acetylase OafA/YrhL